MTRTWSDGASLPVLTASYSGFVNGDTPASLKTPVTLSTDATGSSPPGSYDILGIRRDFDRLHDHVQRRHPDDQSGRHHDGPRVVGQSFGYGQAVTITAKVAAVAPVFRASPTGSVEFYDGSTDLGGGTLGGGVATISISSLAAASHTITAVYSGDGNFTTSTAANLTQSVSPPRSTVTANDATKVYGQANPAFAASYCGFVLGQDPSVLGGTLSFSTSATAASHVQAGGYPVTPGGLTSTNYAISFVAGTLTITPAPLSITADNKNTVYGAPLPALTASYSGFVNGDTPASLTTPVTLSTDATASSPPAPTTSRRPARPRPIT